MLPKFFPAADVLPRLGLCSYDLHQLRTARNEVGERGRTAAEKKSEALRAPCVTPRMANRTGRKTAQPDIARPPEYIPAHPRSYVPTPLPRGADRCIRSAPRKANRRYRGASRSPERHPLTCVYVLPSEKTARKLKAAALRLT
jgi:hypothetical protein